MFKALFSGVVSNLVLKVVENYRHLSIQLLKIEVAKAYLYGVKTARLSAIGLMQMGLVIGLIFTGTILLHVGLFILLPWTLEAKAVLGMCLGLVYMAIGVWVLHVAMTEKNWLEKSGAIEMLETALSTRENTCITAGTGRGSGCQ
jgi:hypothetical protein